MRLTMASRRCFSKKAYVNSFLPSCTAKRFCARSYRPPRVLKVDMPAAQTCLLLKASGLLRLTPKHNPGSSPMKYHCMHLELIQSVRILMSRTLSLGYTCHACARAAPEVADSPLPVKMSSLLQWAATSRSFCKPLADVLRRRVRPVSQGHVHASGRFLESSGTIQSLTGLPNAAVCSSQHWQGKGGHMQAA